MAWRQLATEKVAAILPDDPTPLPGRMETRSARADPRAAEHPPTA